MAEGLELITINPRYFCHHCSRTVSPIDNDELICPDCSSGFLEEVSRNMLTFEDLFSNDFSDVDPNDSLEDLSLINAFSIDNLLQRTFSDLVNQSEESPEEQSIPNRSSFQSILFGSSIHGEDRFGYLRHLGDYIFGDDLDALTTQLLNEAEISGPPPLPKEQIKRLSTISVTKEHTEKGVQCTVCMEDFRLREKAKCLPCEHFYHEKCITPWLERHGTCPNCRKIVEVQSRSRRSRSCPRSSINSTHNDTRRFSETSSISDFFSSSINPFRFL